jgi:hypothetical protein
LQKTGLSVESIAAIGATLYRANNVYLEKLLYALNRLNGRGVVQIDMG